MNRAGKPVWPTLLIVVMVLTATSCSARSSPRAPGATARAVQTVAAPSACPVAPQRAPRTGLPGSARTMVPFTAVTGLLCIYLHHGNGLASLQKQLHLHGAALSTAEAAFNSATSAWPPGAYSCPDDDGSAVDGYFRSFSGETIEVEASVRGCAHVSNGQQTFHRISRQLRAYLAENLGVRSW